MILIDAREGVSGDMLLAAMLGGLSAARRSRAIAAMTGACEARGLAFHMLEITDQGDSGHGLSYQGEAIPEGDASREGCYSRLASVENEIGSTTEVGTRILDLIFEAESEAHGVPVGQVHLHEIGRTQALMNIAGIGLVADLLEYEGANGFTSSVITTGGGLVVVSHGAVRIPAPATAILLRGLRHKSGDSPGERATPTGVAAVRVLAASQVEDMPASYKKRSVGFGTKRFAGHLGRTALLWL